MQPIADHSGSLLVAMRLVLCLMLLVLVAGVLVEAGRSSKGYGGYGGYSGGRGGYGGGRVRYGYSRPVVRHSGYSRGCCGGGRGRGGLYKSTVVVQYAKTYQHGKCCH